MVLFFIEKFPFMTIIYGLLLTNVILDCNCYLDLKIRQFEAKRLNNPCPDFV